MDIPIDAEADRLLSVWQSALESGREIPVSELCRDRPDLVAKLEKQTAVHRQIRLSQQVASLDNEFKTTVAVEEFPSLRLGLRAAFQDGSTPLPDDLAMRLSFTPAGYVLFEKLGEGGMGVVYKALQKRLNRTVAFKVLRESLISPRELTRFQAEAEAVASIRHPNVVQVYESGEHFGRPYLAMEYLSGGDLAVELNTMNRTEKGFFRRAAGMMAKIAAGVHAAHKQGIIHRDLKPANVLLDEFGEPKVSDFGISKREASTELTNANAVLGTPGYMSPEQARGNTKFVGPQADVWSLGVILYLMLTGTRPIVGDDAEALHRAVLRGNFVRPRRVNAEIPKDLESICLKCLRLEPGERYADAGTLVADLTNWLEGRPIVARPAGTIESGVKWVRRNRIVSGAVLAVALAVILGAGASTWQAWRADQKADRANQESQRADREAERANVEVENSHAKMKESQRLLDLIRLKEAQTAFNNKHVRLALDRLAEIAPENRCIVWNFLYRQFQGGLFSLWGHTDRVVGVAFSSDGRWIVSASLDQTAKIWDATTGETVRTLQGHTSGLTSVAISADSHWIVTGSKDRSARVWDLITGEERRKFEGHLDAISCVAISADGDRVVTGSDDKTARLWDLKSGETVREYTGHTAKIFSVTLSSDGSKVATGSYDGTARYCDATTGKLLRQFREDGRSCVSSVSLSVNRDRIILGSHDGLISIGNCTTGEMSEFQSHQEQLRGMAETPDGRRIVTGSDDNTLRIWDTKTHNMLFELKGHTRGLTCLAVNADGRRIVSGSNDNTLRVWDATQSDQMVVKLPGHRINITSAAVSSDGNRIVTASNDWTARVWDTQTDQSIFQLIGHRDRVKSVAISADGKRVVTGSDDRAIRIWDGETGQHILEIKGHRQGVTCVAITPDGQWIASGSDDKTVRLWDVSCAQLHIELSGHSKMIRAVAFSGDGLRLVTCSDDGTARVWNTTTGTSLELKGHTEAVSSVAFSPDGNRIVTCSNDSTLKIWDPLTGLEIYSIPGLRGMIRGVAVSAAGNRIVSIAEDNIVQIWDLKSGQLLLEFESPTANVRCVALSPDSRQIVVGSNHKNAQVWRTSTPAPFPELVGHAAWVTCVATSPDGQRIVCGYENKARIWNATTGKVVATLSGHDGTISSVAFSQDGQRIVTTSEDQMTRVWDAETGLNLPDEAIPKSASRNNLCNGRFALASGSRVILVDPRIDANDLAHRRRLAHPDPAWHAELRRQFEKDNDTIAAEVQRILEWRARAKLSAETGDWGIGHLCCINPMKVDSKEAVPETRFVIKDLEAGKITLCYPGGFYLSADGGGGGEATTNRRMAPGPWEIIDFVHNVGGTVSLRSQSGHFLSCNGEHLDWNRGGIGNWEKFEIVHHEKDVYSLKAHTGRYLAVKK